VGPPVSPGAKPRRREESIRLLAAVRQRYREFAIRFPQLQVIDCMADDEKVKTPNEIHLEVLSCLRDCKLLAGGSGDMIP
jgi:hypothetical protein